MSGFFLAVIILSGIVGAVAALKSSPDDESKLSVSDFTILEHHE